MPSFKRYETIAQQLRQEYTVRQVDLSSGQVPADIDVLLVIAPQGMTDLERYAIDQYLMRGGSVIVSAGNYALSPDPFTGELGVELIGDGVREMLASYGISVEEALVMDPQNEPFPVQVARDLGGIQVREIQAMNYHFFIDVRPDGMDQDSPLLANLPAVTLNWASPINVDEEANANREVTMLMKSSPASWLHDNTNIQPDLETYPDLGFPVEGEPQSYPLAVSVQGVFDSYFAGQPAPRPAEDAPEAGPAAPTEPVNSVTLDSSPDTARLVVIGSAEFLNDNVFEISTRLTGDRYLNSLQFAQNAVDWSVEDLDLLTIRSRGASTRVLNPVTEQEQTFWEIANYIVALLALGALAVIWRIRQHSEKPVVLEPRSQQSSGEKERAAGAV
jgi:ABC-2 type transport system permease protein